MTVRHDGTSICLEGDCPVEDAESLAAMLEAQAGPVHLGRCGRLHAAVVQALLFFRPEITGMPIDDFTARHLIPSVCRSIHQGQD